MERAPQHVRTALLSIAFLLALSVVARAEDVVYVWSDGSIARLEGTILSETPEALRVRTSDGREVDVASTDVANVVRGGKVFDPVPRPAPEVDAPPPSATPAPYENRQAPPVRYRDPSVSFLCSLLVPGGGQFYNGETGSGALLLGGAVVGIALIANADPYSASYSSDIGLGQSLVFASALTSLIMAPIDAGRMNRRNGFQARAGAGSGGGPVIELALGF